MNDKSPNLHKKAKSWRILVVVAKGHHRANGLFLWHQCLNCKRQEFFVTICFSFQDMCKICIRNFNSPKKLPKDVCPIAWPNWQVWCNMLCKNVELFITLQQIQRIFVADNSTIIFRIFIYFGHTFVQSPQHIAITRIGRGIWANRLTSHDVISLVFFTLYPFPVAGTFLKGKKAVFDR